MNQLKMTSECCRKRPHAMLMSVLVIVVPLLFGSLTSTNAAAKEDRAQSVRYFLMIGTPKDETWKRLMESGIDMAVPARKSIEIMGGKLLGYYLGVHEAKNYGIVSFPKTADVTSIVYMRVSQGMMKDIKFIEIMPTGDMLPVFEQALKQIEAGM